MRQIDIPPPNLFRSRGLRRGIGSKDWVPRTVAGRVGSVIFGIVFVAGGLMLIGTSFLLKGEIQAEIASTPFVLIASLLLVMMALMAAFFAIWLGRRLLAGCFRHSQISNRKSER